MTRQRIHLWLVLFSIGLLGITSFSASAQGDPEPEDRIVVTASRRNITYVAPGTDGTTTDIYLAEDVPVPQPAANNEDLEAMRQLLDEAGWIDHDNDPNTPRVLEEVSYEVTNLTNTPGVNEIDPQFSPLGNFIAFRRETSPDGFSLYTVESDGENPVQITPDGVNVVTASFNPDGTQVAFTAQWGSSQFKIYRSDLDGANQFTLTPGEGFNAAFPSWREKEDGTQELAFIQVEGGTSRIRAVNPQTAEELWSTDAVSQQWWILQPLYGTYAAFILRENSEADWDIAAINLDTREVTQITDNDTNDCCAQVLLTVGCERFVVPNIEGGSISARSEPGANAPAVRSINDGESVFVDGMDYSGDWLHTTNGDWVPHNNFPADNPCPLPVINPEAEAVFSTDGVVVTDMQPAGLSSYYLSDTEDEGRDIYRFNGPVNDVYPVSLTGPNPSDLIANDVVAMSLSGSNPVNLTANDNREYTSITPLFNNTLLVGFNETEGDRTFPRLGFTWNITSREAGGDYEVLFLTNGSDPDVVDPISLGQLEGFAAAGLLQTCTLTNIVGEDDSRLYYVHSEPRENAPVVRSLMHGETYEVDGFLSGEQNPADGWYHLTDGTWHKGYLQEECSALPRISRSSISS